MFYVCLNGRGTECEYLSSGFNYQSHLPSESRADLGAGEVEPGFLVAAGGRDGSEHRGSTRGLGVSVSVIPGLGCQCIIPEPGCQCMYHPWAGMLVYHPWAGMLMYHPWFQIQT